MMIKQLLALTSLFFVGLATLSSQSIDDERVLFTVADQEVTVGEFVYIYEKTNGDKADYSRANLEEYLDLYTKFKLKVARSRAMQLDTIQSLQRELEGYRRQLADSYLIDRTITDKLVEAAYSRMLSDVELSHLLIPVAQNAAPADTLLAYEKAAGLLNELKQGAKFEALAAQYSQDPNTKERGGKVGFLTAPFPNGLHRLERAAYNTKVGEVTGPHRSRAGYHLLRIDARRPARGEVEVAHLLIRTENRSREAAAALIDSLHTVLVEGQTSFVDLVETYSEDAKTKNDEGYIGFIRINQVELVFENAAFGIERDDSFSEPIQSSVGFHIIKRISQRPIQPFNVERPRLETTIKRDARFEEAKAQLLLDIRQKAGFQENREVLLDFAQSLTDTFFTFRWKAPAPQGKMLFKLGRDYNVTLDDFAQYLVSASRQRSGLKRSSTPEEGALKIYDTFVDDQLLKYEESKLEENYPDFKALMREYQEGILLFEATKMEVWDKASQDTAGLKAYFDETLAGKYRWAPRARTTVYTMSPQARALAAQIRRFAAEHSPEETLAEFNSPSKQLVRAEEELYERSRQPKLQSVPFEAGTTTEPFAAEGSSEVSFLKIEEIVPAAAKSLDQARGYAIADYQDELERRWVAQLRETFEVSVNKKVFNSLVKTK